MPQPERQVTQAKKRGTQNVQRQRSPGRSASSQVPDSGREGSAARAISVGVNAPGSDVRTLRRKVGNRLFGQMLVQRKLVGPGKKDISEEIAQGLDGETDPRVARAVRDLHQLPNEIEVEGYKELREGILSGAYDQMLPRGTNEIDLTEGEADEYEDDDAAGPSTALVNPAAEGDVATGDEIPVEQYEAIFAEIKAEGDETYEDKYSVAYLETLFMLIESGQIEATAEEKASVIEIIEKKVDKEAEADAQEDPEASDVNDASPERQKKAPKVTPQEAKKVPPLIKRASSRFKDVVSSDPAASPTKLAVEGLLHLASAIGLGVAAVGSAFAVPVVTAGIVALSVAQGLIAIAKWTRALLPKQSKLHAWLIGLESGLSYFSAAFVGAVALSIGAPWVAIAGAIAAMAASLLKLGRSFMVGSGDAKAHPKAYGRLVKAEAVLGVVGAISGTVSGVIADGLSSAWAWVKGVIGTAGSVIKGLRGNAVTNAEVQGK